MLVMTKRSWHWIKLSKVLPFLWRPRKCSHVIDHDQIFLSLCLTFFSSDFYVQNVFSNRVTIFTIFDQPKVGILLIDLVYWLKKIVVFLQFFSCRVWKLCSFSRAKFLSSFFRCFFFTSKTGHLVLLHETAYEAFSKVQKKFNKILYTPVYL